MKKSRIILLAVLLLCLCGCSNSADSTVGNANAENRAIRIQSLSTQLDQYEATLEGISYGNKVKKALANAQKREGQAIANQNDDDSPWYTFGLDWDGDKACDEFEKAINELQNAINNDAVVRQEIARQNSYSAKDESKDQFGAAWKKMLKLTLILAAILVVVLIVVAIISRSFKGKVKAITPAPEQKREPPKETKAEEEAVDISYEEVKQLKLASTSDSRFERECKELGHNKDEVIQYFDGDEKLAKTYISMEVNMRKQGVDKTYRQLYEEGKT